MSRLRAEFMPGSKAEAAATALGVGRAAYEVRAEMCERARAGRETDRESSRPWR